MNKISKYLICVFTALTILFGFFWIRSFNVIQSNNNWKHNYEVLRDSIEVIKTKHGEVLYENGSLIIEKKELSDALDISKKQIKDYEKALDSKIAYISKLEAQLKIKDTVYVTEVIHDTLTNSYKAHYDDNWLNFDQDILFFTPDRPILKTYNISMNMPLKVGIGDNYRIFVTSPNPYFNVTSLEGAVIDGSMFMKKQSRWVLGSYIGFGLDYDLIHKDIGVGPQVGVGIGFRFF